MGKDPIAGARFAVTGGRSREKELFQLSASPGEHETARAALLDPEPAARSTPGVAARRAGHSRPDPAMGA